MCFQGLSADWPQDVAGKGVADEEGKEAEEETEEEEGICMGCLTLPTLETKVPASTSVINPTPTDCPSPTVYPYRRA